MNSNQKYIFDSLVKEGYNVGDEATFSKNIATPDGAKWAFETLSGLDYNLGDMNTYLQNVTTSLPYRPDTKSKPVQTFDAVSGMDSFTDTDLKPLPKELTDQVLSGSVPGMSYIGDMKINHLGADMALNEAFGGKFNDTSIKDGDAVKTVNDKLPRVNIPTSKFSDPEHKKFQLKVSGKPETLAESSGLLGSYYHKFNAGSSNIGASLSGFMEDVSRDMNEIVPLFGYYEFTADVFKGIKDWFKSAEAYSKAKSNMYNGEDFVSLAKKGRYLDAANEMFLTATESLPVSLTAMLSMAAGQPTLGFELMYVNSYQNKADELKGNEDMSQLSKTINAAMTGLSAAATEYLGSIPFVKWADSFVARYGTDQLKNIVKGSLKETSGQFFKKYGIALQPVIEGVEEFADQVSNNFTNYITGETKKLDFYDLFEGAGKSFAYGMAGGMQFSAGMAVAEGTQKFKVNKEFKEADKKFTEFLSANGYTPEEVTEIKNDLLSSEKKDAFMQLNSLVGTSYEGLDNSAFKDYLMDLGAKYISYGQVINKDNQDIKNLIEQKKQQATEYLSGQVNQTTGTIMTGQIGPDEFQITKGNIVTKEDGTIDYDNSDKQFYYIDDNGVVQVESTNLMNKVTSIPYEEAVQMATDKATAPIIAQQENEYTRPYNPGEQVRVKAGNGFMFGTIVSNENGVYILKEKQTGQEVQIEPRMIVDEDNLKGMKNGMEVQYTLDGENKTGTINDMNSQRHNGRIEIDNEFVPVENIMPLQQPENATTTPKGTDKTQQNQPEAQQNVNKAPEYPLTKDGEIDFEKMTDEQTFQYVRETEGEESANREIQNEVTRVQKQISENIRAVNEHTDKTNKMLSNAKSIQESMAVKQKQNAAKKTLEEQRVQLDERLNKLKSMLPQVEKPEVVVLPAKGTKTRPEIAALQAKEQQTAEQPVQEVNLPNTENVPQDISTPPVEVSTPLPGQTAPVNDVSTPAKQSNPQKREQEWGDVNSMNELILRSIIGGQKIRWSNITSDSGAVVSKGLGAEYRFSSSEMKQRIGLIGKDAPTPEQLAHTLWEQYATENGGQFDMDTQDILSEILDIYNTHKSTASMILAVEEMKLTADELEYYSKEIEEYEKQRLLENIPDDVYASILGLTNFTPEQIQLLNNILDSWGDQIINYGTDTTTEEGSTGNPTEELQNSEDKRIEEAKTAISQRIAELNKLFPAVNVKVVDTNSQLFEEIVNAGLPQALHQTIAETLANTESKVSGMHYKGVVYINVQGIDNDIDNTFLHESVHLVNKSLFSNEELESLSETEFASILPIHYENKSKATRGDEILAFAVEKLLNGYSIEEIASGDVDMSIFPKEIQPYLSKIFNKLINENNINDLGRTNNANDSTGGTISEVHRTTAEGTQTNQRAEGSGTTEPGSQRKFVNDDVVFYKGKQYTVSAVYTNQNDLYDIIDENGNEIEEVSGSELSTLDQSIEQQNPNTDPTEAQKIAGNYKKAHITVQGMDITVENPKGSTRSGVDEDGQAWSHEMNSHYGYFKRTNGKDGDHIDVFVGPDEASTTVFVIDQVNPKNGQFDESKVMIGYNSPEEAKQAYMENYDDNWQGFSAITPVSVDEFKKWLYDGARQAKPFSEYKDTPAPVEVVQPESNTEYSPKEGWEDNLMKAREYALNLGIDFKGKSKEELVQAINGKINPKPEPAYGENNKVVTKDRYEELKQRMKNKLNNLNMGFDPELFAIGAEMSAYHIESGARKFVDFAKKMIEDLGDAVRPYLKAFYIGAKQLPGIETEGMNTEVELSDIDVNTFDAEIKANDTQGSPQDVVEVKQDDTQGSPKKNQTDPQLSLFETEQNATNERFNINKQINNRSNGTTTEQGSISGNPERLSQGEQTESVRQDEEGGRTSIRSGKEGGPVYETSGTEQSTGSGNGSVLSGNDGVLNPPVQKFEAEDNDKESFNALKKYDDNITALETLIKLISEKRKANPEEKSALAKYVGFGGLKDILLNPEIAKGWTDTNEKYRSKVKRIIQLAQQFDNLTGTKGSMDSITGSILYAHFTPSSLIRSIYDGIAQLGFKSGSIVEPSAGSGNFITFMPNNVRSRSNITAVEIDNLTGNILKYIHDDVYVKVSGIQEANIPDNSQDLVISNVPFGNYKIFDKNFKGDKVQYMNRIHNYFFVKGVDMAREGGIIAFITSKGVLDSNGNENVRQYLNENTEFLGAVRLPNNAFKNSSNTEVVTDVIFLRKNTSTPKNNPDFVSTKEIEVTHKDGEKVNVSVNSYFLDNPKNMAGEIIAGGLYSRSEYTIKANESVDYTQLIKNALPSNVYAKSSGVGTNYDVKTSDNVKEGNITVIDDQILVKENGLLVPAKLSQTETPAKVNAYMKVRNTLMDLIESEYRGASEEAIKSLREDLNKNYNTFVSKYGKLAKSALKITKIDADGYNVLSLEKNDGSKADIFSKRTIQPLTVKQSAQDIDEAILISLYENASIDIERIAELLGMSVTEAMNEAKGKLFELPEGGFQTRDEYLSGNVKKKLKLAKQASAKGYSNFDINISELENVIPKDIPALNIEARLGSRWIPEDVYTEFAQYLFNDNSISYNYIKSTDSYAPNTSSSTTVEATRKWGTERLNGVKILTNAMHIDPPKVYDTLRDGSRVLNVDQTQKAKEKYDEIRAEFENWVYKTDVRRNNLSQIYNEKFNTSVKRTYNGNHLNIPGINNVSLYDHQKDAIWMLLQNNGGIIDHIVGAGKTYVMIAATMEMKRTGIAKKPMILALKSTIPQIVTSYRDAYPMAKILAPTEKDFTKENRKKLFSQIANNEWDVIIMSHDNYGKIPHEQELLEGMIQEELDELFEEREKIKSTGNKNALKGIELRIKNLEARLERISDMSKDNSLTFEQMGIDHIMVDESQMFKNLAYVTQQTQVAGLSKPEGSKRAFNLYVGIRYLQGKYGADKGTTFLSGTPISNSMVEMYLLLKYLRPNKMNDMGLNSFDSWATTFASPSTDIEYSVTGNLKQKTRFREFINVPELSALYTEIADIRTDDNLVLDKPKMKGNGYTMQLIKMNDEQEEYTKRLIQFAETKDGSHIGIPNMTENQKTAAMLIATNLSSKMAIDMRLINPGYSYDPNGKIATLVKNVVQTFNDTNEYKGTQLIFSDLGTPKNKNSKVSLLRDYMEDELGTNADTLNEIFGDPNQAGYKAPLIASVKQKLSDILELTNDEIDSILYESENSTGGFVLYDEIKYRLIEAGIPEEQIVYIHDYNTQKAKTDLFEKVNEGKVRIVLGSTQKLGTGVNVQTKIAAIHHVDVPWTPASMEQRNGRGIRQGNFVAKNYLGNELPVYAYATEKTLDAYKYQLLETKQRFLDQVKSGNVESRTIMDSDGDGESGSGYAEFVAALSGNKDILTRAKLEQKIRLMQKSKKNYLADYYDAQENINRINDRIPIVHENIAKTKENIAFFELITKYDDKGKIIIDSYEDENLTKKDKDKTLPYERTDYAGKAIEDLSAKLMSLPAYKRSTLKLGEYTIEYFKSLELVNNNGKQVEIEKTNIAVKSSNDVNYSFTFSSTPGILLNNLQKAIENLPSILTQQEQVIERNKRDLVALNEILQKGETWEKEEELQQAQKEFKEVSDRLNAEAKKNEQKVPEPVAIEEEINEDSPLYRIIGEIGASRKSGAEKILDNLALAKQMEYYGYTAKNIRQATGWEKGVDEKWRYEQPDNIVLKNMNSDMLTELIGEDHELFVEYPELKEVQIAALSAEEEESEGIYFSSQFDEKPTIFAVSNSMEGLKSVLIHEIQHAIQDAEGFATGDNADQDLGSFNSEVSDVLIRGINEKTSNPIWKLTELDAIISTFYDVDQAVKDEAIKISRSDKKNIKKYIDDSPYGRYRRMAGEVEARNAQKRMNFTDAQRRNTLLSETEDVERQQQIVLFDAVQSAYKEDRSGNYIGDGKNHEDYHVVDFSEYKNIVVFDKSILNEVEGGTEAYVRYDQNGDPIYDEEPMFRVNKQNSQSVIIKNTPYEKESYTGKPQEFKEGILYESSAGNDTNATNSNIQQEGSYTSIVSGDEVTFEKNYERLMSKWNGATFMGDKLTGRAKITSSEDVAFLFKNLEHSSTENVFAVFISKSGAYKVLWVSHGATNASVIDNKLIYAAAMEFKAKKVTFVHNHPSGNLRSSNEDVRVLIKMKEMFSDTNVEVMDGIVINLDSGKYLEFDEYGNYPTNMDYSEKKGDKKNIPVYQFDRHKLYVPSNSMTKISSSYDIATYLSKMKRGTTPKIGALILDGFNRISRYMLFDETISIEELTNQLKHEVAKHGQAVALHSNKPISTDKNAYISNSLRGMGAQLLDIVIIKQDKDIINNYKSYADEGKLLEPEAKYSITKNNLAPNGKKSKLNKQDWNLVRTEEFKSWFGDWENNPEQASKVLDENGEPLVVYHGTLKYGFDKFKSNKNGIFFSDKQDVARGYSYSHNGGWLTSNDNPQTYSVFVKSVNPMVIDAMGKKYNNIPVPGKEWKPVVFGRMPKDAVSVSDMAVEANKQGYDGLIVKNVIDSVYNDNYTKSTVVSVFESEQIKIKNHEEPLFRITDNLAPNGKVSNLTPVQWKQVRTPEFKSWFGEWETDPENSSKVVDENGEPKALYHGTGIDFDTFRIQDSDIFGTRLGHFFTEDKNIARIFAERNDIPLVKDVFLNIRNPKSIKGNFLDNLNEFKGADAKLRKLSPKENKGSVELPDFRTFRNQIISEGNDGIVMNNISIKGDKTRIVKSKQYVAFDSNQIKSATENNGQFNPQDDRINFRITDTREIIEPEDYTEKIRNEVDDKLQNVWSKFLEGHVNEIRPVEVLFRRLRANGVVISENDDYVMKYTLKPGIDDEQITQFRNNFFKPLLKTFHEIEKAGYSYEDIKAYAILKHGPEYDEHIRNKEVEIWKAVRGINEENIEEYQEQIEEFRNSLREDYSGRKVVEKRIGKSGEEFIAEFETKIGEPKVKKLWSQIKAATSYSLEKSHDAGIISTDTYENVSSMFEYYIPLRGHREETAEKKYEYQYENGEWFSKPLQTAKGRKSESEDPFAYIFSMALSSIVQANNNILKQNLLRLAHKNTKGTMSANRQWIKLIKDAEGNIIGKQIAEEPEFNEDVKIYRENIEKFENEMLKLKEKGEAYQSGDKRLNIGGLFIKPQNEKQHEVTVYRNGQLYTIRFHTNPAVPRAINGTNQARYDGTSWGTFLNEVGKVTRFMSATKTMFRPTFVFFTNPARDFHQAVNMSFVDEGAKFTANVLKHLPMAVWSIVKYNTNKLDTSNKYDKYMLDYMMNGGKTGITEILEIQNIKKRVERDIKRLGMKHPIYLPGKGADAFVEIWKKLSFITENQMRLAVYMAAKEKGYSDVKSARMAKDATIDFNKKGSGQYGNKELKSLFAFINVGYQAINNFYSKVKANPKRGSAVIMANAAAGYFLLSNMNAMLSLLIDGDDDSWLEEYANLSEYTRNSSLCIYLGKQNGFATIPLSQELRVPFALGSNFLMFMKGKITAAEMAASTLKGVTALLPYNPIESIANGTPAGAAPDIISPALEIAANKNFMGYQIYNGWKSDMKPGFIDIKTNRVGDPYAPEILIKWMDGMNSATGGDNVKKGRVSLDPDKVDHLMNGYLGGLYKMFINTANTIAKDDKNVSELIIPKAAFIRSKEINNRNTGLNQDYYEIKKSIDEMEYLIKGYQSEVKENRMSMDEFNLKVKDLLPSENQKIVFALIKAIEKAEKAMKDEPDKDKQQVMNKKIIEAKKRAIELSK